LSTAKYTCGSADVGVRASYAVTMAW